MIILGIRDGIKSKWSKVLLTFIFLSFFGGVGLSAIFKHFMGGKSADAFIVINKEEIGRRVFEARRKDEEARVNFFYQRFGKHAPLMMMQNGISTDPEETARNGLIVETLVDQAARNLPVYIADKYIEHMIQNTEFLLSELYHIMPASIINNDGTLNMDAFQKAIHHYYGNNNVGALFVDKIKRNVALSLLSTGSYVPQFALKGSVEGVMREKHFVELFLPVDAFIKQAKEKGATDAEVKTFFDAENKKNERYFIPAKRSALQYTFDSKDFDIEVSSKEIEDYYNKVKRERYVESPVQCKIREIVFSDIKNNGLIALKNKAEEVLAQAKAANAPEFSTLAQKHSQSATASKGGLVDFFKRGEKDKMIERAAIALKNDGDISDIIELEDNKGYAVIQRIARKEATFKPLASLSNDIKTVLKERKFASEFIRQANRYTQAQDEESAKAFEAFVAKHKGVRKQLEAAQKQEGILSTRLFSLKKRGDKAAFMHEGKGIVIEVVDILKKVTPPFELFKPMVEKDYLTFKGYELLAQAAKNCIEKARETHSLKADLHPYAVIKQLEWVDQFDEKQVEKLQKEEIAQALFGLEKVFSVSAAQAKDGVRIFMLDQVRNPEEAKIKERESEVTKNFFSAYNNLFSRSFIASLYRNATIDLDKTASDSRKNDSYEI